MSSQPTIPQYIPRDDEDLTPAPENVEEDNEGGLVIDDTPVIDATQVDPAAIHDTSASAADSDQGSPTVAHPDQGSSTVADPDQGSPTVAHSDQGSPTVADPDQGSTVPDEGAAASRSDVPVEPIPPVSDPKDDPVVAAAENKQ
jgi:hypothetical protein